MKSHTKKHYSLILELNEREVKWLMDVMQNPINCTRDEETPHHEMMRRDFWDALSAIEDED